MTKERVPLPDRPLFSHKDPVTGNELILGNMNGAFPGAKTLKDCNIVAVLSLLQFGDVNDPLNAAMKPLEDVYRDRVTVRHAESGVRYHLIQMPDVISPTALPKEMKVLEEATCFIDAALQKGNVLVHW